MARARSCPAQPRARRARTAAEGATWENCSAKKSPAGAGLLSWREPYFLASSLFALGALASSVFALPLDLDFFSPLDLAFFSPLAAFLSIFSDLVAAGEVVSDFGACAKAVSANAEAMRVTMSFFSIKGSLLVSGSWSGSGSMVYNAPGVVRLTGIIGP